VLERIFQQRIQGCIFTAQTMDRDAEPEPPFFQSVINHRYRTMHMTKSNTRCNEQRFIHISRQGWYLRTREGLSGPFETRNTAQKFLDEIIEKNRINSYNYN